MRKRRLIQEGATYHVVAKTNRGEFILNSDEMKELFLNILEAAEKKFDFKLKHFCIMSNHVQLTAGTCTGDKSFKTDAVDSECICYPF